VFDGYMKTLTNMDKSTERLLLEWNGVCISNVKGWRMKKALFMVGPGDTGKSQLKSLTERIIGKGNFIGIDLKEIEARFGTGVVYGTRLAGSSDMSFLSVEELKTFKKITGGDSLFAEFKGQQGFEFTYNGLLWFCMNRLPKFGGDDGKWVYDRIMVVECKNEIPKDEQDKTLLDKMYAERDGIVYKAIKALQTVIANGYRFTEPESVSKARDVYMIENNTVVSFYNECMVQRPQNKICDSCSTGRVYSVYKAWCDDNNHGFAKTAKEFRDILSAHLSSSFKEITVHTNRGTFYKELTLSLEAKEHYRKAYGYDSTEFLE
jgi:P4 family phage/plasmid primase-like protien